MSTPQSTSDQVAWVDKYLPGWLDDLAGMNGDDDPGISVDGLRLFLHALRDARAERDALVAALRGLFSVPAVRTVLNPSGEQHVGGCDCPYCVARNAIMAATEKQEKAT